ncbi:MAG: hypothetical protein ABIF88_03545 [archaeon]
MRKIIFCLGFLLLIFCSLASASDVIYTLDNNGVFVEFHVDEGDTFLLPAVYSNLEVSNSYEQFDNLIFFQSPVTIRYYSTDYVKEISSTERLFNAPRQIDSDYSVKLILPKGYFLSEGLIYPKNYLTASDGKNIVLEWQRFSDDEIIVFYEGSTSSYFWIYVLVIIVLVALIVYFLQHKKYKRKIRHAGEKHKKKSIDVKKLKEESVTANLFGDEKKIVEYLLTKKGKSSWTKNLVRDLEIPKVRLSRKIRSLVEKGLVRKEVHGNSNRVFLNRG